MLVFCTGVSFVDQLIKGVLPGREFDWSDMLFDFVGYVVGFLIMGIAIRVIKINVRLKSTDCNSVGNH